MELDLTNTLTLVGILVAAAIAFWRIGISNIKRIDRLLTEHRNEIRHEVNEKIEVLRGNVHELRGDVHELRSEVHGLDRRLSRLEGILQALSAFVPLLSDTDQN